MGITHRGSLELTDTGTDSGLFLDYLNIVDPTTTGQVVYKAGEGFKGYGESGVVNLGASAGVGGAETWDEMYDLDKTLTIDTLSMNFRITANVNGFVFNKTIGGAGNVIDITNEGSGYDIEGHGDNWNVTSAGAGTFTDLILGDDQQITFGGSSDIAIDYDSSDNALDISGTTNFEKNVTHEDGGLETWGGTAGATVLTLTKGDMVMSDSSLDITDADNATSLSLTNNSYITGDLISVTAGSIITGNILQITAAQITSGNFIDLDDSGGGLTGYYITCNSGNTVEFAVGEDGATDIVGTAGGTQGLHVIGVPTSDNMVLFDNTGGDIAIGKAVLKLDAGGDIDTGGNILRMEYTGAGSNEAILLEMIGTADVVGLKINFNGENTHEALYIDADSTDKDIAYIHSDAVIASSKAVLSLHSAGNAASGSNILRLEAAGTPVPGSIALEIVADGKAIVGAYIDADAATASVVEITGAGNLDGANMLDVVSLGTAAASSDSVVKFAYGGADDNTPTILEIAGGDYDVTGIMITADHAAQTTWPVNVICDADGGDTEPLRLQQDDANVGFIKIAGVEGSSATSNVVVGDFTGATGVGILIDVDGSAIWLQGYKY